MRKKKLVQNVLISDMSATGKGICRIDNQVVFVDKAIPGDLVDILIFKKKKSFSEARVETYIERSEALVEPQCDYFGTCGGCKWQNISYAEQLKYKEKQVIDNLTRIGKIQIGETFPILPAPESYHFRNKLEYTFSNKKWLSREEIAFGEKLNRNGLGFHIPGQFDKVLDINTCHIQREPTNTIRNYVRDYALNHDLTFYDIKEHKGLLRNLVIRTTEDGQVMVILLVGKNEKVIIEQLLESLTGNFPEISSCWYIVNSKKNDSYGDLEPIHFSGEKYLLKSMQNPYGGEPIKYQVGPKSFYQTNAKQAEALYHLVWEWADIQEGELVYDLYTGTGTIANYIAKKAKKVIGIEYVEEAVVDARINSNLNNYEHLEFFSGDMKDLLTKKFFNKHGKPDIIITDPPRAGMHQDVVEGILEAEPNRIVYVSCNPATQARDLELLSSKYDVLKSRAVDMFPHTPHVENVCLLKKKS